MTTYITNIADNINESDTDLNTTIQAFMDDNFYFGTETTVSDWRIANYAVLRQWAYPDQSEFSDAQIKLNSGISELITQGEQQLEDYVQDCLNIKNRFPKE